MTLIGRNGAGKTTTLRSIMGIVAPRGGHVTFDGFELAGSPHAHDRSTWTSMVLEERRILPNLSVEENPAEPAGRAAPERRRCGDGGGAGPLPAPARASGPEGQEPFRRRAADAGHRTRGSWRAPSSCWWTSLTEGLSPIIVESLTKILREINRRGTTILLVEQILEVGLRSPTGSTSWTRAVSSSRTPEALRADPAIQQRFLGV